MLLCLVSAFRCNRGDSSARNQSPVEACTIHLPLVRFHDEPYEGRAPQRMLAEVQMRAASICQVYLKVPPFHRFRDYCYLSMVCHTTLYGGLSNPTSLTIEYLITLLHSF